MLDDAKVDVFVVKNTDFYRAKWQRFQERPDTVLSFNAAALIGQHLWLAYRKLYTPLLALVGVSLAVGFANALLILDYQDFLASNESLVYGLNLSIAILLLAVPGLFGNYWYWRRFRTVERHAASRYPDTEAQSRYLQSRGGTNPIGVVALILVLLMPIVWIEYQTTRTVDAEGFVFDAKGPLTLAEVRANFIDRMDMPLEGARRACVFREIEQRARAAGDPEILDPATVELVPAEQWKDVGAFGRRLVLAQAIVTKALFVCA